MFSKKEISCASLHDYKPSLPHSRDKYYSKLFFIAQVDFVNDPDVLCLPIHTFSSL